MPTGYSPSRDIPRLDGKVFLVTGGTAGLGLQTVEDLAAHSPAHICIMGRNAQKAETVMGKLRLKYPTLSVGFIKCDMASLSSVQRAAREFLTGQKRIDVLICNAGVMCIDPAVTEDGYQVEFQTNHLGHALLIKLLLPLLHKTSEIERDVRIVNLSSQAYRQAPKGGIDFATLTTAQLTLGNAIIPGHAWARYGQTKLANMLYADALALKYPNIKAVSVHPGYIFTDLFNNVSFIQKLPTYFLAYGQTLQVDEGAHSQLWAATAAPEKVMSGAYYEPVGVMGERTTAYAKDGELANRLFEWTQQALKDWS